MARFYEEKQPFVKTMPQTMTINVWLIMEDYIQSGDKIHAMKHLRVMYEILRFARDDKPRWSGRRTWDDGMAKVGD